MIRRCALPVPERAVDVFFHWSDIATGILSKSGPVAGFALIGMAYAADPQAVTPVAAWLLTKPTIVQGSIFGGVIFLLIGDGTRLVRVRRALASALFAYMGCEGILEITQSWLVPTPAIERLMAMVLGVIGVVIAETLLRSTQAVRDGAEDATDRLIDKWSGGGGEKR